MGSKPIYDPDLDFGVRDSFDDAPKSEPGAGPGDERGQQVQDDEVTV